MSMATDSLNSLDSGKHTTGFDGGCLYLQQMSQLFCTSLISLKNLHHSHLHLAIIFLAGRSFRVTKLFMQFHDNTFLLLRCFIVKCISKHYFCSILIFIINNLMFTIQGYAVMSTCCEVKILYL